MRHHLLSTTTTTAITMAPTSSSSASAAAVQSLSKPQKKTTAAATSPQNCPSANSFCNYSPSATLDLIILILVLFSGTFLISSYFSYIFNSISLLLPSWFSIAAVPSILYSHLQAQPFFYASMAFSLIFVLILFEICCGRSRSRKCGKIGCKGLKKAMEFDLQLQGEEFFNKLGKTSTNKSVKEIDELPWKGGTEFNPDYECLRAELRKMAPPNGRAVLLFRLKCGCPIAKLEGWGPKRGRRHKKSLALYGAGDHR